MTYSLGLSFAAPDAVEMKRKRLGEFAKEARLAAQAKTNSHGVIYRLKTFFFFFFARASVRTQLSHGTVNW